jgi:hypothetical protein
VRRAAKRDKPERSIISAAEALGAVVLQVSGVGLPDTLVLHKGRTYLVEVKQSGAPITHAQSLTFSRITKSGVPVYVVETPEDMHRLLVAYPSLRPWSPDSRPVEGKKKRPHRYGVDRARTLAECCLEHGCARSRLMGEDYCLKHTKGEQ